MQRDIDEVEVLLDLWAEDMRKWKNEAAGYPSEASGGFVPSWCRDSEEQAEDHDRETITRVDACFNSLAPVYKDAVWKHYRFGANVFSFAKNADFETAKIVIRVKFVQRGLL